MQGADIHTVAQLLGHKDLRMAARYRHLSSSYLAKGGNGLYRIFGHLRYQGVTEVAVLREDKPVNLLGLASPTGFEPVLPH